MMDKVEEVADRRGKSEASAYNWAVLGLIVSVFFLCPVGLVTGPIVLMKARRLEKTAPVAAASVRRLGLLGFGVAVVVATGWCVGIGVVYTTLN